MSSTGQLVGGVVGAVVGFFAGAPLYGASFPVAMGSLIAPVDHGLQAEEEVKTHGLQGDGDEHR